MPGSPRRTVRAHVSPRPESARGAPAAPLEDSRRGETGPCALTVVSSPFPRNGIRGPMNRSPILFRCDGSAEQGYEAFYQCLVLAAAMQRRRRGTHFLSRLDPLSLALVAHRGGHEWREATDAVDTGDDVEATLREVRRLQAAAVVVAAPAVGEDYYRELCATGTLVVAIDSTAEITFPNRLVVNPLLGVGKERYRHERGTQLLVGTRYALVRPMVRRLRPIRAQEPPQPFRGLVMLGDDDRLGQSLPLARQLLDTPKVERVDVAVRTHHA